MFAAVYAGNFYVVIDVHSPETRIHSILETLHPAAIITDNEWLPLAKKLAGASFAEMIILYEDAVLREINRDHLMRIRGQMIDTDPLYVLFTSGSSGMPKGTVLSHRSVISYTTWVSEQFEFGADTVFGSQTPLYFSMSVTDLFSTIKCGSTYHMIPKTYFTFPIKLVEFLNERKINTLYWVPSALAIVSNWNVFDFARPEHLAENPLCRRSDAGEAPQLLAKIPAGLSVRQPVRTDRDDRHLQFLRGGSKLCRQ